MVDGEPGNGAQVWEERRCERRCDTVSFDPIGAGDVIASGDDHMQAQ